MLVCVAERAYLHKDLICSSFSTAYFFAPSILKHVNKSLILNLLSYKRVQSAVYNLFQLVMQKICQFCWLMYKERRAGNWKIRVCDICEGSTKRMIHISAIREIFTLTTNLRVAAMIISIVNTF